MKSSNKRVSRERLEALIWLQCSHIEALTETIRLLRRQNELLHVANQKIKEEAGLLPKVRPYPKAYEKKTKDKADKKTVVSDTEG